MHRNQSMDVLRILACMGVMLAHSAAMCFTIDVVEDGSVEWVVCYILKKRIAFEKTIWKKHVAFGVGTCLLDIVQCIDDSFKILSVRRGRYEFLVYWNVHWIIHFDASPKVYCCQ